MSVETLHLLMTMIGTAILGIAAVVAIIRIARGPSILDRVVGADVLIAVVIAALVLEAVVHRHSTTIPVMLVLSLVGFSGAVSVARLVGGREAPRLQERPRQAGEASGDPADGVGGSTDRLNEGSA